jgi:hypothetical protein
VVAAAIDDLIKKQPAGIGLKVPAEPLMNRA